MPVKSAKKGLALKDKVTIKGDEKNQEGEIISVNKNQCCVKLADGRRFWKTHADIQPVKA